ncbi:MAG: hypothetical protein AABZ60_24950 [Planctomycetota bacterium]
MIEYSSLQWINNGALWKKHQLPDYNILEETQKMLKAANFSIPQLKTLFQLLEIGLPPSKTKKGLETALIQQIQTRATSKYI